MRDFKEARLIDITIGNGTYGIAAPAVPKDNNKYTYLRITDINDDGSLNFSDLKSVDDPKANKYLLKPNDIVFARTGNSTGRSYFYDGSAGELVYAGFLIKFSLDSHKVNPKILKYYTHSKDYYNWVASFDSGATRGNINAKTFAEMPITLPPRNIQDKIVAILSSLDEKIETNRKINARLEELAQAIFKSWFIDFEPFGGKMPLTWKNCKLEDIAKISSGKRPSDNGTKFVFHKSYPIVGASSIMGYTSNFLYDEPILVIGRVGTHGIVQRWKEKCWPSDNTLVIKSKYYNFAYNVLMRIDYSALNRGSTQPLITQTDIKQIELIFPTLDILDVFENKVTSIFNQIEILSKESARLAALRDTLLPKLMSGELIPE